MSSREEAKILVGRASAEMGRTEAEIVAAFSPRAAFDIGAEMPDSFGGTDGISASQGLDHG
ncbi:hypothetical protein [Streptomyces sp. NPDC005262]|uniref:hypothetical protein n=1 Tax=Streptomyces sp. NPDC005262 TaxID=3364710 RepID=UPI0036A1B6FB